MGKLGHPKKELTGEDKKKQEQEYRKHGYHPKSLNLKHEVGFVAGDLSEKKVVDAACGSGHTACITAEGEVFTWGNGKNGALGHGNWD